VVLQLRANLFSEDRALHGGALGARRAGVARSRFEQDRPDHPYSHANLAHAYLLRDRLGEALATIRQAELRKLDLADFLILRYQIAFLQEDPAEMERTLAAGQRRSDLADWITGKSAFAAAYAGRLRQARTMSRLAADLALQAGHKEAAAQHEAAAAVREALLGNVRESRQIAAAALKLSHGRDVVYGAALALAFSGETATPQKLADELDKRFPEDTSVRTSYLPSLRALLEINGGNPAKAIELLETATPYDLAWQGCCSVGFTGSLYPSYVRGLAWLAARHGEKAAAEFQRILDHRGIAVNDPIGILARLQLGQAWSLASDRPKARNAFQQFLAVWKDADPDIPVLKEAKAASATLE